MVKKEKKCSKHSWQKADEPCYCETDEIEDAHMSYYCSKCGIDRCEFLRIREALAEQKAKMQELLIKMREQLPYVLCYGLENDLTEKEMKDFEKMFVLIYEKQLKKQIEAIE